MPYLAFIVGVVVAMVLSVRGHEAMAAWTLGAALVVPVAYEVRVGLLEALGK